MVGSEREGRDCVSEKERSSNCVCANPALVRAEKVLLERASSATNNFSGFFFLCSLFTAFVCTAFRRRCSRAQP